VKRNSENLPAANWLIAREFVRGPRGLNFPPVLQIPASALTIFLSFLAKGGRFSPLGSVALQIGICNRLPFYRAVANQMRSLLVAHPQKVWGKGNWLAQMPKHGKIIQTPGGSRQREIP